MEEYTRSCSRSPYARQSLPSLNIVPVPTQNRGQFGLIQTPPAPVQPNAIGGGQTPQPISGPFAQAQPQGTVQGFRRNGTHLNQTGNMQQWVAGPSQAQFPSPNQQQSQLNGFNQFGDIPQGQQQRIPQASLFQVQVPQGPNSGQQQHYFHHYESQPPHPVQGVQVPPVRGVTTLQQVPPGTQPPSSQIPHGQGQPIRIAYVPQPGGTVQQQPHIQPTSPPNVPPNGDPQQRHDQPNKRFPTAWNPSQPLVSQMGHHWAFAGRPLGVDTNVTGPRNGQLGSQGKGSAPFSANGASTRSPMYVFLVYKVKIPVYQIVHSSSSTNTPISNGSPVQGWDGPPSHIPLLYPNNSPVVGPSFKRAAPGASQLTADIIDLTLDDNEEPHLRPLKRRKTDSDIPQVVHANGSGGAVPNLPGQNSLDVSGGVPLPPTSGPPVRSPASGLLSTEEQSQPDTTARPSLTLEQTGMRVDENAMEQDKSIASQPPAVSAQEATEPPVPVQESAGPTPVILAQELNIPPPVQEPTGSPPVVSAQEANEHQVSERAQDNTVPEPEPEPEPTPTDWRENPDIIETLNSVFVMSEEDNSAKLCALCRYVILSFLSLQIIRLIFSLTTDSDIIKILSNGLSKTWPSSRIPRWTNSGRTCKKSTQHLGRLSSIRIISVTWKTKAKLPKMWILLMSRTYLNYSLLPSVFCVRAVFLDTICIVYRAYSLILCIDHCLFNGT